MKITRIINDIEIEIELTEKELSYAYHEHSHNVDTADIKNYIEENKESYSEEEYAYLMSNVDRVVSNMGCEDGDAWCELASFAIDETLEERQNELSEKADSTPSFRMEYQ